MKWTSESARDVSNNCRNGGAAVKLGFFTFWNFAAVSQLRNEGHYAAKWHSCAKSGFAASKYPTEWSFSCEIGSFYALVFRSRFAAVKWGSLCCEMALVCQNVLRSREIPCGMGLLVRNQTLPLRNAFRSCEMMAPVLRSGTRVPKVLSQPRNPLRNRTFVAKSAFFTSQWVSQLPNDGSCAVKWHSCAKSGFVAAKIFAERAIRLRTGFAAKCRFRRGCEISQTLVFALFFYPFLLRKTSFQFLCNSSWFWSSRNLYYIKKIELKHWNQN